MPPNQIQAVRGLLEPLLRGHGKVMPDATGMNKCGNDGVCEQAGNLMFQARLRCAVFAAGWRGHDSEHRSSLGRLRSKSFLTLDART